MTKQEVQNILNFHISKWRILTVAKVIEEVQKHCDEKDSKQILKFITEIVNDDNKFALAVSTDTSFVKKR